MQDNISVLLASILAVIIIVLFPVYNVAMRQDSIANNMVVKATTNFVDEVRNKGYIEKEEYENYLNELDKTGNRYEVELEVYKPEIIEVASVNAEAADKEYEEKYVIDYTDTILDELLGETTDTQNAEDYRESVLKDNVYYLDTDYKFYVRVKNTNTTQAQILMDRLLGGETGNRVVVNYGGIVYKNEWAKGENAQAVGANISISRPMDADEVEYTYGKITETYDQYTDETTNIYGIKVELTDSEEGGTTIKFLLKYKDVLPLKDASGNELDEQGREQHIKDYVSTIGFMSDIVVEEILQQKLSDNVSYNYEYMITLTDVVANFDAGYYIDARVQIKAGSADTSAGPLGLLNSEEFVLVGFDILKPTIELSSNPDVINESVITPAVGGTEIDFTATAVSGSLNAEIDRIEVKINNNGVETDLIINKENIDENGKARFSHTFTEGDGWISIRAIDTRENTSETKLYGFVIRANFLEQSISTFGVTEMETVEIDNAIITAYSFYVKLPSHSGSDWWRITGLVKGTTDTWEVINPLEGGTVPKNVTGQTLRANSANGSDFKLVNVPIDLAKQYTKLKFEYCTDPSHKGRKCLKDATIKFEVKYKFINSGG